MTDEDLAERLAQGAGKLLLELRRSDPLAGPALGRVADRTANEYLIGELAEWRPQDALLSEESADRSDRLRARRVWIIDPLDGTREYSEGRSDWAVHVGLSIDGEAKVGAVAVPAAGLLLRSDRCAPPRRREAGRLRMLVSRTRPPAEAAALAAFLDAEMVPMGSAGAKAAAVICGDADLYFHMGGQHQWDNCAPAAVAIGAGFHASRVDGAPLVYNQAHSLVPDLLIARPDLARKVTDFFGKRGVQR